MFMLVIVARCSCCCCWPSDALNVVGVNGKFACTDIFINVYFTRIQYVGSSYISNRTGIWIGDARKHTHTHIPFRISAAEQNTERSGHGI